MLRIAICEDEDIHAEILEKNLILWSTERDEVINLKRFVSGESLIFQIEDECFDLIILDIQMGILSGVETAYKIREKNDEVGLVFVTSREEFALKGYGVGAINYILKPANKEQIFSTMDRFIKNFKLEKTDRKYLNIVSGKEVRKLDVETIIYCVVFSHYTDVITAKETINLKKKLSELEEELPQEIFLKPHRSYLINVKRIKQVLKDEVIMDNGDKVPIARGKRDFIVENYMRMI